MGAAPAQSRQSLKAMSDTPHLGLPLIAASQSQKHVTHNQAIVILDAIVMLSVIDSTHTAPPASPAEGDRYKVASGATGAWAAWDLNIALYTNGQWVKLVPKKGWLCFDEATGALTVWTGSNWTDLAAAGGGELQNLTRLGVGTTADATNPFAAKLNNALWTARGLGEGGDGSLRYKMNKDSAGDTLSLLMQTGYEGRAEIGLTGDDDFHFKVSADGAIWRDAIVIDKDTGEVSFPYTAVGGGAAIGANLLLNGGFGVDQRNNGASVAVGDDTYCFDRWYVLTQNASINVAQQTDQENGTPHNIRMTQNQATAQRMGLAQIVEARDCKHLRGDDVVFKARVRCSASQAIRYAILGWTGSADVVTSDVVNNWISNTYTAGNFFLGTNLSIIAVGATTPAANAWTDLTAITGAVDTSVNNLIVFIWTEAAAAQNLTLDIARAKLESGTAATEFAVRPYAEELALCQRYFESLSSITGLEVYGIGQCASTNRAISFYAFKAIKRAPPTLTFSATAHWAYYNQNITQFVAWSSVSAQLSLFGAMFDVTTATSNLGGTGQATLFGPNNTATARMNFDAEL